MTCLHKTPGLPSVTDYRNEEVKSLNTGSSPASLRLSEVTSESDLSLYMPKQEESSSIILTEIFYPTRIQS